MKLIYLLLALLGLQGLCVAAEEPPISVGRVFNRPLAEVKAAVQKFCGESKTIEGISTRNGVNEVVVTVALWVSQTNDVPEVSYSVRVMDCTWSSIGVQSGEISAVSAGPSKTRLEFRPAPRAGNAERLQAMEKGLDKIAAILNRPQ